MGTKEDIFYKFLSTTEQEQQPSKETTKAGLIEPIEQPEAVALILDEYINLIDEAMQTFKDKVSKSAIELLKKRFITFNEYKGIFDTQIDLNYVFKNIPYETREPYIQALLNINFFEYDSRRSFISNNKPTFENFIKIFKEKSHPLQNFFFRKLDFYIKDHERKRHTYFVAGSGAGKSEMIKSLIYQDIKKQTSSILLIEPHGDLAEQVAQLVEDKTRLVYIDPFLDPKKTPCLNPFEIHDRSEENITTVSQEITRAFESILEGEFTNNMKALLIPCISTLLRKGNSSLFDLQRFMDDDNNSDLVELGTKSPFAPHSDYFCNGFYKSNTTTSKNSIYTKLQILLNDYTFANLLTGKSTIDLEKELNTNGKVIIFKLVKGKMQDTISPLGRFIVSIAQSTALKRANTQENFRQPTHFYIDEFQNFISPTIDEILAESRKYKFYLTFAHQFINQIEDTRLKNSVLSNTALKFIGKLDDQTTVKTMSSILNIDEDLIKNLRQGEFYFRINNKTIKINNTKDLLGNKGAISPEKWNEHKEYQLKNYYKNLDKTLKTQSKEKENFQDQEPQKNNKYNNKKEFENIDFMDNIEDSQDTTFNTSKEQKTPIKPKFFDF